MTNEAIIAEIKSKLSSTLVTLASEIDALKTEDATQNSDIAALKAAPAPQASEPIAEALRDAVAGGLGIDTTA